MAAPRSLATNLSPEVLVAICSINANFSPWDTFIRGSKEDKFASRSHIRDTVNASHVCRSWRTILLSTPKLWKHMVNPYNPRWSEIVLARSYPEPFSFSLPSKKQGRKRDEKDFEQELGHQYQGRITEYQFRCSLISKASLSRLYYLQGSMNARYLPKLTTLSLSFPTYTKLPTNFPGTSTPNLTHLHLRRCFFEGTNQASVVGGSLSTLHMDDLALTEKTLVDVLRALPLLRCLVLNKVFANTDGARLASKLASANFLGLAQLEELRIVDKSLSSVTEFLGCVTFSRLLSIFSLELYHEPEKGAIPDTRLYYRLACILSTMSLCKSLPNMSVSFRRGLSFTSTSAPNLPICYQAPGESRFISFPKNCFYVRLTALSEESVQQNPPLKGDSAMIWNDFVSELYSTLGNLGAYSSSHRLAVLSYRQKIDDMHMVKVLQQCRSVVALTHVNLPFWHFLNEADLCGSQDSRGCVLPRLQQLSFAPLNIALVNPSNIKLHSASESDESTLSQSPSHESGSVFANKSGSIDNSDSFGIDILLKFCRQRKDLRVVHFPALKEGLVADLRKYLEPLGVEVRA